MCCFKRCRYEVVAERDESCCTKFLHYFYYIFYFFCSLSGQYTFFPEVKDCSYQMVFSVFGCLCFIGHSIIYIVYAGITVTIEVSRIANLSEVINSTENESIHCALPQEHWKFTTAIFFSTFSAFFSYIIITVFILIPSNWMVCCCCCKRRYGTDSDSVHVQSNRRGGHGSDREDDSNDCFSMYKNALKEDSLSPFSDDDELSCKDGSWFFANYVLIMLVLLCCGISVSVAYVIFVYHQPYCWFNAVGIAMTMLHLITQFCAVQSCFIFSKIVYVVINRLRQLEKEICEAAEKMSVTEAFVCKHNPSQISVEAAKPHKPALGAEAAGTLSCVVPCLLHKEEEDREVYHKLREIDQKFIEKVKPTLDLFGYWFIFHWIAYAVTTMLLSAFIVQVIIDVIRYNLQTVDDMIPETAFAVTDTKSSYVSYVVFFTLVHAYLFLYPCLRAAAIATARAKLITKISNQKWDKISVPIQVNFVRYLTSQNFAFRVSLFCTNISFGFNWVFISFFIAICGAYLRF